MSAKQNILSSKLISQSALAREHGRTRDLVRGQRRVVDANEDTGVVGRVCTGELDGRRGRISATGDGDLGT